MIYVIKENPVMNFTIFKDERNQFHLESLCNCQKTVSLNGLINNYNKICSHVSLSYLVHVLAMI